MTFVEEWNKLSDECFAVAKEKGFHDREQNLAEGIALMHSELSEALEAIRHGNPADKHLPDMDALSVELADAVIRIAHFAARNQLPVGEAVVKKLAYNRTREYRHGKKF